MPPQLVLALGNPGARYAATRHNAGFWFANAVAARAGAAFAGKKKLHGEAARAGGAWLLKPQTFMNESGKSARAAAAFYGVAAAGVLVAHDEMDLPPGAARLKFGGGNAGHNGLASVGEGLQTRDFWRLRIGVGRPPRAGEVEGYVLSPPTAEELAQIQNAIAAAAEQWENIAAGAYERAMLALHTSEKKE